MSLDVASQSSYVVGRKSQQERLRRGVIVLGFCLRLRVLVPWVERIHRFDHDMTIRRRLPASCVAAGRATELL